MQQLLLIYDGDCPLCRNFVAAQRLQQQFGELTLLNARDLPEQAPLLLAEDAVLLLAEAAPEPGVAAGFTVGVDGIKPELTLLIITDSI